MRRLLLAVAVLAVLGAVAARARRERPAHYITVEAPR